MSETPRHDSNDQPFEAFGPNAESQEAERVDTSVVEELAKGLETLEDQLKGIPEQMRQIATAAAEDAVRRVLEEFVAQQSQNVTSSPVVVSTTPTSNNPARDVAPQSRDEVSSGDNEPSENTETAPEVPQLDREALKAAGLKPEEIDSIIAARKNESVDETDDEAASRNTPIPAAGRPVSPATPTSLGSTDPGKTGDSNTPNLDPAPMTADEISEKRRKIVASGVKALDVGNMSDDEIIAFDLVDEPPTDPPAQPVPTVPAAPEGPNTEPTTDTDKQAANDLSPKEASDLLRGDPEALEAQAAERGMSVEDFKQYLEAAVERGALVPSSEADRLLAEIEAGQRELTIKPAEAALLAGIEGDLGSAKDIAKMRRELKTGFRGRLMSGLVRAGTALGRVAGYLPTFIVDKSQALFVKDEDRRHDFMKELLARGKGMELPEDDAAFAALVTQARLEAEVGGRIADKEQKAVDATMGEGRYELFTRTFGVDAKTGKLALPEEYQKALSNEFLKNNATEGEEAEHVSEARQKLAQAYVELSGKGKGSIDAEVVNQHKEAIDVKWQQLEEKLKSENPDITDEELTEYAAQFERVQKVLLQEVIEARQTDEYGVRGESVLGGKSRAGRLARGAGLSFAVGAAVRSSLRATPVGIVAAPIAGAALGTVAAWQQSKQFKRDRQYNVLGDGAIEEVATESLERAQDEHAKDRNRRMGGIAIRALAATEGMIAHDIASAVGVTETMGGAYAAASTWAGDHNPFSSDSNNGGYAEGWHPDPTTTEPTDSNGGYPEGWRPGEHSGATAGETMPGVDPDAIEVVVPTGETLVLHPTEIPGVGVDINGNEYDMLSGREAFGNYDPTVADGLANEYAVTTPLEAQSPEEFAEIMASRELTEPRIFTETISGYNNIIGPNGEVLSPDFMQGMTENEFLDRLETDPEFFKQKYIELKEWEAENGITYDREIRTGGYTTSSATDIDGDGTRDLYNHWMYRQDDAVWVIKSNNPLLNDALGNAFRREECGQFGIPDGEALPPTWGERQFVPEGEGTGPGPEQPETPGTPNNPDTPDEPDSPDNPDEPGELEEKDPTRDINVNSDLPEQVQMGDDRVGSGEYQSEESMTPPPDQYVEPNREPDPTPAPDATPTPPQERESEVDNAPTADGANSEVDQAVQQELQDSGAGSLEEDENGTPIGNDGRVDG